ncbi:MAG TPA: sulfate permease [Spongiibacteraceae bacterium]|nr:sulfate permease [Spongiibacteraceae bacterium]
MNDRALTQTKTTLQRFCPEWVARYRAELLPQDLIAGIVVAIMLVPQSMAYAIVAGLPPQYGMYASILPLIAYALFGTSMTLAVGPVAVTSLMTATALTPLAAQGSAQYAAGAALLALIAGIMSYLFGVLRFGFLAKLLSNPVISGFTSGASLLILIGQINPLIGTHARGDTAFSQLAALIAAIPQVHLPTAAIGVGAMLLLFFQRKFLAPFARLLGARSTLAAMLPKLMPMFVVLISIFLALTLHWHERFSVAVVGAIPQGLPQLQLPGAMDLPLKKLLFPSFAIALINFVSSFSVAQALALKRREKISADAELRALGAANAASAISGGFPVNGGFARSLVNYNAGAQTPLAGVISAVLMAIVVAQFTSIFTALPRAVLAATIIVAVAPVIDVKAFFRAWRYDRADAFALAATAVGVISLGVESGIAIGIGVSLASLVWRSSNPHIAVLGRVPYTEQFRNIKRYQTETLAHVLALRIDENLLFANAQAVEEFVRTELADRDDVRHVLLVLSSVSQIDATALDMLIELNSYLHSRGIDLNFSEIKGPVLDRLKTARLLDQLTGQVYLSTHKAFQAFSGESEDYAI